MLLGDSGALCSWLYKVHSRPRSQYSFAGRYDGYIPMDRWRNWNSRRVSSGRREKWQQLVEKDQFHIFPFCFCNILPIGMSSLSIFGHSCTVVKPFPEAPIQPQTFPLSAPKCSDVLTNGGGCFLELNEDSYCVWVLACQACVKYSFHYSNVLGP